MQNAAAHVARAVCRQAAGRAGQVVCLCGTGNNGGDGLAAMRILMEENPAFRGECWLLPGRLSADAQRELDRLTEAAGSPPHVAVHRVEGDFAMPEKVACAIDALFGTGPVAPAGGRGAHGLRGAPSAGGGGRARGGGGHSVGAERRDGAGHGAAVRACETVTFHRPKPGAVSGTGAGLRQGRSPWRISVSPLRRPRRWMTRTACACWKDTIACCLRVRAPRTRESWAAWCSGPEAGVCRGCGHRRDGGPARGRGAGDGWPVPEDVVDVVRRSSLRHLVPRCPH